MLAVESTYDVTMRWPGGEVLEWAITAASTDRALLLASADLIGTDREMQNVEVTITRRPRD